MSVPLRFPTMIPIGPWCLTTTKSTVKPTVMTMFARVAIENATRALLRSEEVRHLGVVDVGPEEDGGRDDETRAAAVQVGSCAAWP